MAPILGLERVGIAASSRLVSARATAAQRVAGTVQIAIAGVLGGAALAFVWHLGAMLFAHPGFEARNRHAVVYSLTTGPLRDAAALRESSALSRTRMRDAIAALPGVAAVSVTDAVPGVLYGRQTTRIPHPLQPGEQLTIFPGAIDAPLRRRARLDASS